ncbi:acid stress response protein YqgB [Metakosakonia massiliensis]|nr:acid stress response protein YqgB [Phytobacter massiliensis]
MNKKPVAQSVSQSFVLESQAVYGLLSQSYAAIVVDCLTLNTFEVRYV